MTNYKLQISIIAAVAFLILLGWHHRALATTENGGESRTFDPPEGGFQSSEMTASDGFQLYNVNFGFTVRSYGSWTTTSTMCLSLRDGTVECTDGQTQWGLGDTDVSDYYAAKVYGSYSCQSLCAYQDLPVAGFDGYTANISSRRVSIDNFSVPSSVNQGDSFNVNWETDWATDPFLSGYPKFNASGPASCTPNNSINLDNNNSHESGLIACRATGSGTITLTLTASGVGAGGAFVALPPETRQVQVGTGPANGVPGAFTLTSANAACSADGNSTTVNLTWTPSSSAATYNVHSTYGIPSGTGLSSNTTSFTYLERKGVTVSYYIEAVNAQGFTNSNEISGVVMCPRPTVTFSASPTSVDYNTSSTLSYSSANAYVCNITGGSLNQAITPNTAGTIGSGNLTTNTIFTFKCSDPDGGYDDTKSVTVTVGNPPPPGSHNLSVNITGNGAVSSTPSGINNCRTTCTAAFTDPTTVTLTATQDSNSTFSGWSGGGCSGSGNCVVTVNGANITVTATFTQNPVGSPPTCTSATPDGTQVYGNTTQRITANGVQNTTQVGFYTWSLNGTGQDGQDDLIFQWGTAGPNNTYFVDENMASHVNIPNSPDYGAVVTHVYMWNNTSPDPVWCNDASYNTIAPAGLVFNITYTAAVLNAPTNETVTRPVCERLTTSWQYTSNGVEDGFYVYRSTDQQTWDRITAALLPSATRSYQDTPPQTNVTYYYRAAAHRGANLEPREASYTPSIGQDYPNMLNQPCIANVSVTNTLDKVNGAGYNGSGKIAAGDTLTYKITIINNGPANATVNLICDDVSGNLQNIRNLTVTGSGSSNGGISQSNPSCTSNGGNTTSGLRFNVTGTKDVPNNWLVTFDATFTPASSDSQESVSEKACINYTDSASKWVCGTAPSLIVNTSNVQAPTFREVAP